MKTVVMLGKDENAVMPMDNGFLAAKVMGQLLEAAEAAGLEVKQTDDAGFAWHILDEGEIRNSLFVI